MRVERGRVDRNMYKGHMDKAKVEEDRGWEVGMAGVEGSDGRKWGQLYLNNNLKSIVYNLWI